jgi:hypothetical protein
MSIKSKRKSLFEKVKSLLSTPKKEQNNRSIKRNRRRTRTPPKNKSIRKLATHHYNKLPVYMKKKTKKSK